MNPPLLTRKPPHNRMLDSQTSLNISYIHGHIVTLPYPKAQNECDQNKKQSLPTTFSATDPAE